MKFFSSLASVALLAQLVAATGYGGHGPYCGTVTDTYTKTKTQTKYAPTVTATYTKKLPVCFETETHTKTKTKHVESTSYVTTTKQKTKTIEETERPTWTTTVTTKVVPTCTPRPGWPHKRSLEDDEEEAEIDERDLAGMTNAERIRRGLPLAKPGQKRSAIPEPAADPAAEPGYWHPPKPSCYPSHTTTVVTTTKTKTVTPTDWETVTKCKWTKTLDETDSALSNLT